VAWSPDGTRVATCSAGDGKLSSVSVLDVLAAAAGGTARTITLPGRHDVVCAQLLWSPDGTQLIYSAVATTNGLTEAANLQHGWTVIDLRTGAVHDVAAPGQPAAWLPGRGQAA
jgi:WD40 repeat protein